ncbi:DEAD-box ATP-dependent RNA helicase 24 [Zea mays]|uniref:DEAD-box ATP-dependent RNA helicase 24 n=1 Tax=Zea mays TaxID=4577 RepID=A0A1D6K0H8_MAIZE|nr:DEAD-box ATP-dependent RNA helicase 24 [Zea mays]
MTQTSTTSPSPTTPPQMPKPAPRQPPLSSLHPGLHSLPPRSLHPSLQEITTKMGTRIQKVHGISSGRENDHQVGIASPC